MTGEPIRNGREPVSDNCHVGTGPQDGETVESPPLSDVLNPLSQCPVEASGGRELLDPEEAETLAMALSALAGSYEVEARVARMQNEIEAMQHQTTALALRSGDILGESAP